MSKLVTAEAAACPLLPDTLSIPGGFARSRKAPSSTSTEVNVNSSTVVVALIVVITSIWAATDFARLDREIEEHATRVLKEYDAQELRAEVEAARAAAGRRRLPYH
jgi:hypothetical protein